MKKKEKVVPVGKRSCICKKSKVVKSAIDEVYKEEEEPEIKIIDFVNETDGTATVTYETNKAFDEYYKKVKGKKRVTKKGLGNFILEIMDKSLDGKGEQ